MTHADGAYSYEKALLWTERMTDLRQSGRCKPVHMHFIISDLCNEDCHFCAYRMSGGFSTEQFAGPNGEKNPNRMIPYDKIVEILDSAKDLGIRAVQFTGGGEPTVHPKHMDAFIYAQTLGFSTALVTNGLLLKPSWEWAFPRMSWIRVSVDAASAREYSVMRKVPITYYDRVLVNIGKIAETIRITGSSCLLGVGYVVTPENWKNVAEGVARLRDTGAAYVRLSAMFSEAGVAPFRENFSQIRECVEAAKAEARPGFDVVDKFGDRISDLALAAPDYDDCHYQQFTIYVGGDQKVYRCCTTSYTRHGEVGDLRNKTLGEWWESRQADEAYRTFNARSCKTCQFNGQNRAIASALSGPAPLHAEFV